MNSSTPLSRNAASRQTVDSNTHLVELGLSLATAPLLLCLIAARALTDQLQDLGHMSEEVFRGDRLPLLTVPTPSTPSTDRDNPE